MPTIEKDKTKNVLKKCKEIMFKSLRCKQLLNQYYDTKLCTKSMSLNTKFVSISLV